MKYPMLILLLVLSPLAQAADRQGNYAVWGLGERSCFRYQQRPADMEQEYKGYIMGFLSAYNILVPDTYRISGSDRFEDITAWLDAYCESKGMHSFEQALYEYTAQKMETRLTRAPAQPGR